MGIKKYNSYAPRESLGKRPQAPIFALIWAKWAPKDQKIQIRNKTPNICIYPNFKVGNSMATLFFENVQNLILFKALRV